MVSKYVTYLHAITINEKRSHGFERARRGVFGRVWRKGKEGRNDVIIISKIKGKWSFLHRNTGVISLCT